MYASLIIVATTIASFVFNFKVPEIIAIPFLFYAVYFAPLVVIFSIVTIVKHPAMYKGYVITLAPVLIYALALLLIFGIFNYKPHLLPWF